MQYILHKTDFPFPVPLFFASAGRLAASPANRPSRQHALLRLFYHKAIRLSIRSFFAFCVFRMKKGSGIFCRILESFGFRFYSLLTISSDSPLIILVILLSYQYFSYKTCSQQLLLSEPILSASKKFVFRISEIYWLGHAVSDL